MAIVHSYALTWNEEYLVKYYLRYYSEFCDKIVIYDNESTDRTPEIVRSCPKAELRTWSSNNQINENFYLDIKESCYKESRGIADWVIVGDCDEFVFHPNLSEKLEFYKQTGVTIPKVQGYEMTPNCKIDPDANLPFVYQRGMPYPALCKRMIFNPNLDITYSAGCHDILNITKGAIDSEDSLYMLHYKKLNLQYYIERNRLLRTRLSSFNINHNYGIHYNWTPAQMESEYNQVLADSIQIF